MITRLMSEDLVNCSESGYPKKIGCYRLKKPYNLFKKPGSSAQLALHDTLTRLPNRILLEDRLDQAISKADREGTHLP